MGVERKTKNFLWVVVAAVTIGGGYGLKLAGEAWLLHEQLHAARTEAARFARGVVMCSDDRPLPSTSSWAPATDKSGLERFDVWDEDAFRCSGVREVEKAGTQMRWELLSPRKGRVLLQSSSTKGKMIEVAVECDEQKCHLSSEPTRLLPRGDGV